MADEHAEARADFPTSMLTGGIVLALVIVAVLGIFVFGMGGHGTSTQPASSAAPAQQRH
jgi:hypothetical protein